MAVAAAAVTVPLIAVTDTATVEWGGCEDNAALRTEHPDGLPGDLQCATLAVPVDWDDPGREVHVRLARLPHTGEEVSRGSMIYIPGVPGTPEFVDAHDRLSTLREHFDVVTYDPRGNWYDENLPMDDCAEKGLRFTAPDTGAEFYEGHAEHAAAREACRGHDPEAFDNVDSATIVRDVDAIREALGDDRLNALANSYGGTITESHARQFPRRVRTMYMDSTGNHVESLESEEIDYLENTEKEFAAFEKWCARESACALSGEDVSAVWLKLVAKADKDPIPVSEVEGVGFDGHDLQTTGVIMMDEQRHWKTLAKGIVEAREGDASTIAAPSLDMGGRAFAGAAGAAVECGDGRGYRDWAEYREGRQRGQRYSPHFPETRANRDMFCVEWPTPVVNPYGPLPGDDLPPMLGAAADTELPAQHRLSEEVPGSVVIEVEGFGHGHSMMHGDPCVVGKANAYLLDGTLPPRGTSCPAEED